MVHACMDARHVRARSRRCRRRRSRQDGFVCVRVRRGKADCCYWSWRHTGLSRFLSSQLGSATRCACASVHVCAEIYFSRYYYSYYYCLTPVKVGGSFHQSGDLRLSSDWFYFALVFWSGIMLVITFSFIRLVSVQSNADVVVETWSIVNIKSAGLQRPSCRQGKIVSLALLLCSQPSSLPLRRNPSRLNVVNGLANLIHRWSGAKFSITGTVESGSSTPILFQI